MSRVRLLAAFAWDFVVGDDPLMFAVVVAGLAATAVVATTAIASWWILPVAVIAALALSVLRARPTS